MTHALYVYRFLDTSDCRTEGIDLSELTRITARSVTGRRPLPRRLSREESDLCQVAAECVKTVEPSHSHGTGRSISSISDL